MVEPITQEDEPRYLQLCTFAGHLIMTFATLEGTMAARLKLHLARHIEPDNNKPDGMSTAAAIYGSMRFKASRDTMKRIMAAEKADTKVKDFIVAVFEQVAHIEALRDLIAHQQVSPSRHPGTEWVLNDMFTTRDSTVVKTYAFKAEAVNFAANDIGVAAARLFRASRESGLLFSAEGFDFSPIAWRYKSSMLKLLP